MLHQDDCALYDWVLRNPLVSHPCVHKLCCMLVTEAGPQLHHIVGAMMLRHGVACTDVTLLQHIMGALHMFEACILFWPELHIALCCIYTCPYSYTLYMYALLVVSATH